MAAVVALALGAALPAVAAGATGPIKDPQRPSGPALGSAGAASTAIGPRLLVTFDDRPDRAEARRRLGDLGTVSPLVPEAGVWTLRPVGDRPGVRALVETRAGVAAAEWPARQRRMDLPPAPIPPVAASPVTDPLYVAGQQWALAERAGAVWSPDLTTILPRPRIAILDSGIDRSHEEWSGPNSPLVAPRNVIRANADAGDWGHTGHGTHVAGIAAAPLNGVGIVGVAPAVRGSAEVIPVRISDQEGRSGDTTMMAGIRWAVNNGARVINISAGGPTDSRAFRDTVLWATNRGALIVASVGNDGDGSTPRQVNYPAGYPRVLGVGAQCDNEVSGDCPRPFGVARFSNRNETVDVIAPGVGILSSVPVRVGEDALTPGYAYKDGTSMATPYVAGLAALVQAANGNRLSPYQVKRQIENTARRVEPGARNDRSGFGAVDPWRAVTLPAPADDVDEVNDDIKWVKAPRVVRPGQPLRIRAFADRVDDQEDVYAVRARRGDRLQMTLESRTGVLDVYLWGPGARTVATDDVNVRRNLLGFQGNRTGTKRMSRIVRRGGIHYVNVYARRGRGDYTLTISLRRS